MNKGEAEGARGKARQVTVDAGREGQRIDNFLLAELRGVPRSHVYRLLRTGQVRVNKGRAKPVYRVKAGDIVRIPPIASSESPAAARPGEALCQRIAQAVIYEDADVLVVNKPAGIPVHGGSGLRYGLIEALRVLRPEHPDLALVHRLDRYTSGCLLAAKNRRLLPRLQSLFRDGAVEKRYLTLLKRRWQGGARTIDLALAKGRLRSGERMVQVDEAGKEATTSFKPLETYAGASLMEVSLGTGRTHQIRVHAAAIGCPVAGDDKYGDPEFNRRLQGLGLKRIFLHAHALAFDHPETGRPIAVSAPLPEELREVLGRIEKREE